MFKLITLHKDDNVAVASMSIPVNKNITSQLVSKNPIPYGHKIAFLWQSLRLWIVNLRILNSIME